MQVSPPSYLLLPEDPGIYQFLDSSDKILYVGKAKNLKARVASYFTPSADLAPKTAILVSQVKRVKVIKVESEIEALLLEANFIKKFSPKYNIKLTDGKNYPLIRITVKEIYPAVLTARRPDDPKSIYFGPFPSSMAVRSVLRLLRRVFPYHSTSNHPKKVCLYYHLGLCPCVPAFDKEYPCEAKELGLQGVSLHDNYKKTIRHVIDFLDGNTGKVLKDLQKERDNSSKKEDYETSAKIQKQIDNINFITHPVHKPFEYETNPNLKEDLRYKELLSLQTILNTHGMNVSLPNRIECYDNSNIQGTNPTSSMVVLTNGEIDKSQYRKFKIKKVKGPNDFASMQEVLSRRLNHPEWPFPDLIIVDGGKGQISAANEILDMFYSSSNTQHNSSLRGVYDEAIPSNKQIATNSSSSRNDRLIPLIGLAKREETIITSDFQEIKLKKSDPALQLVMRIRDEAHRFAITFHRKLRSKNTFTT